MLGGMLALTHADRIVEQIAADLGRDPRTVVRVLAGLTVRPSAAQAIRRALIARGLTPRV